MNQRAFPASAHEARIDQWCVATLAVLAVLLALVFSFFTNREVYTDDLGLYNPIYMFVHYNKMTYPVYDDFDAMFVHPPTHYLDIALLMKAGLDLFHAAATPAFAFILLGALLTLRGRFPPIVKIGLLLGPYLAIIICGQLITLRPELDLATAWFAGLVALESARLDDWDARRLFLGSFLLTYASGVHYVASIDFTGILVYVVWVWRQLGFTAARPKILAMIAGGCLFGVPYLVFFLFPNWNAILSLAQSVQASGGPLRAVRLALAAYRAWAGDSSFLGWHGRPMLSALTFPVRWSLVPAAVLGPLLLLPHRSTRGIALAALPHLLFLWLYFRDTGKALNLGYYVPEFMLYVSGLIIALLAAALWAAQWLTPRPYRWLVLPAMTPLIAASTLASVPIAYGSDAAEISLVPRLDDMDVARASGMAMLGPGAFVGASDLSAWYTPGATHVYGTWAELDYARDLADFDIPRYLSSFDALVVDARTDKSGMTSNFQRKTPTAWYIDRTLNLRGFYFGNIGVRSWSSAASYLLLSPQAAGPLVGYAFWRGALYRFQQQAGGDTVFVTAVCSGPAIERMIPFDDQKTHGFFTLSLPGARPSNRPDYRWALDDGVIKVMLIDRLKYEGIRPLLRGDCRLRDEIWGTLGEVPVRSMLAQLHREDRPIRFYETLTNAIANVKGTLVTMMSPQSRSYDAGRSSRLFAADFTRGWELTSAKPGIQIADDPHTAKITTDGSAYRWQLLSPPITTPPRSTYLLKFDLTIERGGAGVQIVTADRRITLAALCESAPTGRPGEHQVFFKTGDQYAVEIAITNCGSPRPATSVFWIRNMQIWGQR